jgi:hypothetical protein
MLIHFLAEIENLEKKFIKQKKHTGVEIDE